IEPYVKFARDGRGPRSPPTPNRTLPRPDGRNQARRLGAAESPRNRLNMPSIRPLIVATISVLVTGIGRVRAGDIPFVTGGTGADERADLQAKEKDYNLKIVAAATSGDYLAGVRVVIESADKKSLLETRMEGPILLAKLPPGTYTIKATYSSSTR